MKPRHLSILMMLLTVTPAYAQRVQGAQAFSLSAIGLSLGYHDMYNAKRVGEHVVFIGSADFFLTEKVTLNVRAEYFETQSSGPLEMFSWKNGTLGIGIIHRVSAVSALGAGLGAEWIKPHRYSRDAVVNPLFDPNTGQAYSGWIQYNIADELIRPSLSVLANIEWPLSAKFKLKTELCYKLSFVGKKYGLTPLNSLNTYGVSVGLMYNLLR